jgi:cell division protein FtsN
MARDYAKYATYRKGRSQRNRLWIRLGLLISLIILGLGLFFLKSHKKRPIAQQTTSNLKQKTVGSTPAVKPPEPKFDFYNILPQDPLPSSSQSINNLTLSDGQQADTAITSNTVSVSSRLKKPLTGLINANPEQVAMIEAKKQLDREINQLSNDTYILVLGNFQKVTLAEQYQAQALLKGFPVQSKINKVNKRINYQLFMGPYSRLALASQQQKRLNLAGIESILVKGSSRN